VSNANNTNQLRGFFEGILDHPRTNSLVEDNKLTIAGWIDPHNNDSRSYFLRLKTSTVSIDLLPDTPRPDVAIKRNALPLDGDNVFCGFHHQILFADEVKIYIVINNKELLWKVITFVERDISLEAELRKILSIGFSFEKKNNTNISYADKKLLKSTVEFEFLNTRVINIIQDINEDYIYTILEKLWLTRFLSELTDSTFFARFLLKYFAKNNLEVSSPFASGNAKLIGSFFVKDANYLMFDAEGRRFYIVQYLHSVDFVYFPDISIVLTFPNSHYESRHLQDLISFASTQPIEMRCFSQREQSLKLGGVVLNGISPYHFFYDCLPALYLANNMNALKEVTRFYSINGACYFPVESLYDTHAKNVNARFSELPHNENNSQVFFFIAGLSYKFLNDKEIVEMDQALLKYITSKSQENKIIDVKKIDGCFPIIWIGISAQKRAWINQKSALVKTIQKLYSLYPNLAIIFDGMTSSIYKIDINISDFDKDHLIVKEIVNELPKKISVMSIIGFSSMEKLDVARYCHFFITNYSTGSMYPARFFQLPGVTHLSNTMMNVVKDIHVHYKTSILPSEFIIDVPDQQNPRLDFISYSIDEEKFAEYVCSVAKSSINI
jgi:hypothetical protein